MSTTAPEPFVGSPEIDRTARAVADAVIYARDIWKTADMAGWTEAREKLDIALDAYRAAKAKAVENA